jgi:hypothetical protein
MPGQSPHPRRDPRGHSYGLPEPTPPAFAPDQWHRCEWYLYGVDLYNFSYWWECHEAFEGLWHAVGHKTPTGQFLQALIQVAAANLKRFLGKPVSAATLSRSGLARLRGIPPMYMGVDVAAFADDVRASFEGSRERPALLRLALPSRPLEP